MSLIFGSLGYSGSTPEPSHCPECERCRERIVGHCLGSECSDDGEPRKASDCCLCSCWDCRHSDWPFCTEPQEHELCGHHKAEAEQARAEYLWEEER